MKLIKCELEYCETNLNYSFYSKENTEVPNILMDIVNVFRNTERIDSKKYHMKSDEVLSKISRGLKNLHFKVEEFNAEINKKQQIKIKLDNDKKETNEEKTKEFRVDAINISEGIIIEVEAGRAVANYQFLKDMMECSMISSKGSIYVDGQNKPIKLEKRIYLVIAVRNEYLTSHDYRNVKKWLDTFAISRLDLNLKGILLIGY